MSENNQRMPHSSAPVRGMNGLKQKGDVTRGNTSVRNVILLEREIQGDFH